MNILIAQAIALAIALPAVPLYLLECAVILRDWNRSFNTSFFRLFLFSAFNNLFLNFFLYIFLFRLSELGFFVDFYTHLPPWLANFCFCNSNFTFHLENFLTTLIMAHRLSAILWPMNFEHIWKYALPLGLLLSTTVSLALIVPIFSLDVFFDEQTGPLFRRVVLGYNFDPTKPVFNDYQVLFYTTLMFLALSTGLNLAIMLAYKRHRAKWAAISRENEPNFSTTLEFRLYMYNLAMFVGMFLHCTYYIIAYFSFLFPDQMNSIWGATVNQYIWINDLRVLAFPAWFLFWACSEVSIKVREMVKRGVEAALNGPKTGWKKLSSSFGRIGETMKNAFVRKNRVDSANANDNRLFIVRSEGRRLSQSPDHMIVPSNPN